MKIWLFCHQFFPEFQGGTETLTLQMAQQLILQKHDVTVLTGHPDLVGADDSHVAIQTYFHENIKTIAFRRQMNTTATTNGALKSAYWNEAVVNHLNELIDKQGAPDMAHITHFAYIGASIIPALKKAGVPVVFTTSDFFAICPKSHLQNYDGSPCSGPLPHRGNCLQHILRDQVSADVASQMDKMSDDDFGNLIWLLQTDLPAEINQAIRPSFARADWFKNSAQTLLERKHLMDSCLTAIDAIVVPSSVVHSILMANNFPPAKTLFRPFSNNAAKAIPDHIKELKTIYKDLLNRRRTVH